MTRPRSRAAGTPLNDHQFSQPRIAAVGPLSRAPLILNVRDPSRRVHFRLTRRDNWTHRDERERRGCDVTGRRDLTSVR